MILYHGLPNLMQACPAILEAVMATSLNRSVNYGNSAMNDPIVNEPVRVIFTPPSTGSCHVRLLLSHYYLHSLSSVICGSSGSCAGSCPASQSRVERQDATSRVSGVSTITDCEAVPV